MSATVSRSRQGTQDLGQAGVALGALTLAVALLVTVTVSRQSAGRADTTPLGATAPVVHDHGWSSAETQPGQVIVRGTSGGAIKYMGIPYTVPGALIVRGTSGGGLNYTGIPYPAPRGTTTGGAHGTRFAQ